MKIFNVKSKDVSRVFNLKIVQLKKLMNPIVMLLLNFTIRQIT